MSEFRSIRSLLPGALAPDLVRYGAQGKSPTPINPEDFLSMSEWLAKISSATERTASIHTLTHGLAGRPVTIGTDRVSVIKAERLKSYILLNPSIGVGLTTTATGMASTALVASGAGADITGNTNATPVDVSTYREAHVFVNITNTHTGASAVSVWAQAQDPESGLWADAQSIVATETAVGTYYAALGGVGVTRDLSFRYVVAETPGTAQATFSIGVVLKDGLSRSAEQALSNSIYLGPNGVSVENGFPLLEGTSIPFYIRENLELFAVSRVEGLTLRVFEL